jgi:hypothetical protein
VELFPFIHLGESKSGLGCVARGPSRGAGLPHKRAELENFWAVRGILARQYLRVQEALKIEQVVYALHDPQNNLADHAGLTVTRSDSSPP